MTTPSQRVPNSDNSPAGLGNTPILNANGVGNGNQQPNTQLNNLINSFSQNVNLDPTSPPPKMETFIYSPEVEVRIATDDGEYDVSADLVRGNLFREENSVSTFFCELANQKSKYTKNGGAFKRMDRITVYMKRVNRIQVFSGYLDTVPFAQMWAGNVTLKASCTLKRLLYTYWNPNLPQSASMFNQVRTTNAFGGGSDSGIGDLLGNLVVWVGGFDPQNVHIQDFPNTFYNSMLTEFEQIARQTNVTWDSFQTLFEGSDHTAGPGAAAGQANLSTGPGLGPQVITAIGYKQQVLQAVDDRGMGPDAADIQNSYTLEQLSQTGQSTKDNAVRTAFEQNSSLGQNLQTQARAADAAVLAFACVYAESSWKMYANKQFPESMKYHYDDLEPARENDSMGLFQQRNQGWGSIAQRMNAYASAGMFLDALAKVSGWQNMDPATAIATVQRNTAGAASYAPWVDAARTEVQGLRAGQGKYVPQSIAGIGPSSVAGSSAAQAIVGVATGITGVPGISQNNPSPSSLPVAVPGRPQPDAAGAVNCARLMALGRPVAWGGSPPVAFDSATLVWYCYKSVGVDVGRTTQQQRLGYKQKIASLADARPGDVIQLYPDRSVMLVELGQVIEAGQQGTLVSIHPINFTDSEISGIYRYADYGGPGPAPFNPIAGPGAPVGTGQVGGSGAGSDGSPEPIARNLFSYIFTPDNFSDTIANLFSGQKSFIDSQPLMQEVQAVAASGLRKFASAPNGDFVAYYPDYFGVDGKPIAMKIEKIEMKDVRINLTDDAMATHVYIKGDYVGYGQLSDPIAGWITSAGVATVENETLFQRLKQVVPGGAESLSGNGILQRYGVRPLQLEFSSVHSKQLEFLMACHVFMQKWAEQYQTTATFTFMPEIMPGMRVQLADTGIAVYVSQVTHNFDWEQGFTTTARIMAPSQVNGGMLVDTVIPNTPPVTTAAPPRSNLPGG
jgi:hypothetical protein